MSNKLDQEEWAAFGSPPPPDPLNEVAALIAGDEPSKDNKALAIILTESVRALRRIADAEERKAKAQEDVAQRLVEYIQHAFHTVR